MTLSEAHPGHRPYRAVLKALPLTCAGLPPITQITFPACRPHYPGGSNQSFEACSRFTRVTACKIAQPPIAGFIPGLPPGPLPVPNGPSATMSYRYLHGWNPPPLVTCAFGAHGENRAKATQSGRLRYRPVAAGLDSPHDRVMFYHRPGKNSSVRDGYYRFQKTRGQGILSGFGIAGLLRLRDNEGAEWTGTAELLEDGTTRYRFHNGQGERICGISDNEGILLRDDAGNAWRGFVD